MPTMMTEGLVKPCLTPSSWSVPRVAARLRCFAVVPQCTRAAGVSGESPASMRFRAMSGRFFMPMTNTRVFALAARAFQLWTEPGLSGFSCPVMSVTDEEKLRCVKGMPA